MISGTKDYDYIYNNSSNVTINAKAGDDYIESWYGNNARLSGGAGNDSIKIYGGESVTTNGGKGNDFISLGGDAKDNVILYTSGDGNELKKYNPN